MTDATNLEIPAFTPGVITDYTYELSANADLWTMNMGLNQDLGIFVERRRVCRRTLSSGRRAAALPGRFSPNAAYADAVVHLQPGVHVDGVDRLEDEQAVGRRHDQDRRGPLGCHFADDARCGGDDSPSRRRSG